MSVLPINLLYQGVVMVTTKLVTSNPGHGKVYSMQHYVMKFVGDLRQVGGFLLVLYTTLCDEVCQ